MIFGQTNNTQQQQVQFTEVPSSKTYIETDNLSSAITALTNLFESQARLQHFEQLGFHHVAYDYKDVLLFLDELKSVVLLVFDKSKLAFIPKDLEWIKQQVMAHLVAQAQ